jgi:hypothetical protein
MEWLTGVPSPNPREWEGYRTAWHLSLPEEVRSHYLSCFERGRWGDAPGLFPVEELEELCKVKSVEDQKDVWSAFSSASRIQYGGDILGVLMDLPSYPIPVTPHPTCVKAGKISMSPWNIHPGPVDCMNVELPDHMRKYEVNTDWSEFQAWVGPWQGVYGRESRMPVFAYLLDQLCLGSAETTVDGLYFESVMNMENPPWNHLAELTRDYSKEEQIQIVKDWGVIMRNANAKENSGNIVGWTGLSVATRRNKLEKALLRFLIKRLIYEKLVK